MQIGISTASFFSRLRTEQSLAWIGQQGVPIAETFLDSYSEYSQSFAHLLRQVAQENGVHILSVHAMASQFEPQLFSIGARQKRDAWDMFEQVLSAARTMGASNYVFHGPAMLLGAAKNIGLDRIGPITCDLAAMAQTYDIRLCWENVSWAMFSYPEFGHDIQRCCQHDNLGFTFDIKQAMRAGYDPFAFLEAMGERISHIHLCDVSVQAGHDKIQLSLPGRGAFDFARLGRKLREIGYQGCAMIEVYSNLYDDPSEVSACCALMQDVLN